MHRKSGLVKKSKCRLCDFRMNELGIDSNDYSLFIAVANGMLPKPTIWHAALTAGCAANDDALWPAESASGSGRDQSAPLHAGDRRKSGARRTCGALCCR